MTSPSVSSSGLSPIDQSFRRKMVLLASVTRNVLTLVRRWMSVDICSNGLDAVTEMFNQLHPDEMVSRWWTPASTS